MINYSNKTNKVESVMVEGLAIRVGDSVSFKYDIEQAGRVEAITKKFGRTVVTVRAFKGEYVDNINGTCIDLNPSDLWLE